jgi:hypothetical protein
MAHARKQPQRVDGPYTNAAWSGLPLVGLLLLGCSDSESPTSLDGSNAGATGHAASGGASSTGAGGSGVGRGGTAANAQAGNSGSLGGASTGANLLPERLQRYLLHDTDRSVRFELDAVTGLGPYASSTEYLSELVGRLLNKPDGVSFEADESLPPQGEGFEWSFEALDAYARAHAEDDSDGPVTIHVLFVDGRYVAEGNAGTVLGLAWGQRFIALFQEQLRAGCSGGLLGGLQDDTCEVAERNVWAHEIGHVIGLVDNGVPIQSAHRDAEHGAHDVSDACVMYWAYEGPALFDTLLTRFNAGQSPDIDFCENCWADLAAAR